MYSRGEEMKELSTEQKMTIKEVAEILGVKPDSLRKNVRKTFPDKMKNGETTYLTEKEVVRLKRNMIPTTAVAGAKTEAEMVEQTIEVMAFWKNKHDQLLAENKEMLPKAEFYDCVTQSRDTFDMGEVAKILKIGRNNLFRKLREKGVFMAGNDPYQKYCDRGYFKVVEMEYEAKGSVRIGKKTVAYQKGIDYIKKILKGEL